MRLDVLVGWLLSDFGDNVAGAPIHDLMLNTKIVHAGAKKTRLFAPSTNSGTSSRIQDVKNHDFAPDAPRVCA